MLAARHRLRHRDDFSATVRARRSGSRLLVIHLAAGESRSGSPARVGFVVSKAVGNAVVRNRTKRRLRALMAGRLADLPPGVDVVVRAQPVAADASYDELGRDLDRCLRKVLATTPSCAGRAGSPPAADGTPGVAAPAPRASS